MPERKTELSPGDKKTFEVMANFLDKVLYWVGELSPNAAHELAVMLSDHELPYISDLQTLASELRKLSK